MSGRELRPTEGARFLLERRGPDDGGPRATYACVIATPDAEYAATATLVDDGTAVVSELVPDGPEALRAMLEMFGKLTARGAAKRRDDGMPTWPARILRWRGPGR